MEMLLLMVVLIGLMYVLMVLPQKKKLDAQKRMLAALEPGTRVMLNTGMFGTIRATGEQQMVIELAPGVEITILKQAVMRVANPDEEEFEFDDAPAGTPTDEFIADPDRTFETPEYENPINLGEQSEQSPDFAAPADFDQPVANDPLAERLDAPLTENLDPSTNDDDFRSQTR